jgi:hypothetical protein
MRILFLILIPLSCYAQKRLIPSDYLFEIPSETYSIIQSDGVTVIAECIELNRDLLVFDIEIKNESQNYLNIDPEDIHYYWSENPLPDYKEDYWESEFRNESKDHRSTFAMSPNNVHEYYSMKIRSKKNTKTILAVIGAALVLLDAVQDVQDFRSEPTINRVNKSIARDVGIAASLTAINIADEALTEKQVQADEDLYFLPEEILVPSQLAPGDSIRGKVYFHQSFIHKNYRLLISVEDIFLVFDFKRPSAVERRSMKN